MTGNNLNVSIKEKEEKTPKEEVIKESKPIPTKSEEEKLYKEIKDFWDILLQATSKGNSHRARKPYLHILEKYKELHL